MNSPVTMIPLTNEMELVTKAQHGDRNAYSELVRLHADGVLNVAYRMCGNAHMAEDAAQEAFLQAWLNLNSYRPQSSLRNWLYRIAVNAVTDMLRKEVRLVPEAVENLRLADSHPGPEAVLVRQELTVLVQNAVLCLPEACRAVLVLREYEGLTYQEIATSLDIPVGTVMSRLNYARGLLKESLKMRLVSFAEAENV
jgi:RNA polymerase sigma-70 factor (ECF subfamily)